MMDFVRHFPLSGQSGRFLQLRGNGKLNSRPVFIITDNPSITETKQTPQNSPKHYGNIKIKESNRE